MPSRQRQWWEAFTYVPGYCGPDNMTRRSCGCCADPYVFGHEDGCKLLAGAA